MRTVTRYQARDGSIWDTEELATKREVLLDECALVEDFIGPRPQQSHGDFVQHTPVAAAAFHHNLVDLARKYTAWFDGWAKVKKNSDVHPGSVVGRILDDAADLAPLKALWWRLMCFDQDGREWEQPYFANLAREGKVPA